jgi:uncharacterized protein YneF (UPF0154 family)
MSNKLSLLKVKELLESYYEGRTTLNEEKQLKRFFANENIPPEFEADRLYFESLEDYTGLLVPPNIESIVTGAIQKEEFERKERKNRIYRIVTGTSIAASLLLFFVVGWFIVQNRYSNQLVDTYTDPQIAFEQTRALLQKVSKNMNKASKEIQYMSVISETMEIMEPINQLPMQLNQASRVSALEDPLSRHNR